MSTCMSTCTKNETYHAILDHTTFPRVNFLGTINRTSPLRIPSPIPGLKSIVTAIPPHHTNRLVPRLRQAPLYYTPLSIQNCSYYSDNLMGTFGFRATSMNVYHRSDIRERYRWCVALMPSLVRAVLTVRFDVDHRNKHRTACVTTRGTTRSFVLSGRVL